MELAQVDEFLHVEDREGEVFPGIGGCFVVLLLLCFEALELYAERFEVLPLPGAKLLESLGIGDGS